MNWIQVPDESAFDGEYMDAPGLEQLAKVVMEEHAELAYLREWSVRVLWRRQGSGKEAMGRCKVLSGELRFFTGADWLIWAAADFCKLMSDRQIEALLFHELMHCEVKVNKAGQQRAATRGHDFEGFGLEVERYGAWDTTLVRAKDSFRQLELGLELPRTGPDGPRVSALVRDPLREMARAAREGAMAPVVDLRTGEVLGGDGGAG